jgi:hypothetical protein
VRKRASADGPGKWHSLTGGLDGTKTFYQLLRASARHCKREIRGCFSLESIRFMLPVIPIALFRCLPD